MNDNLEFSILDPSGNITLLVESAVNIEDQPVVASELMKKYPEAEQVGFVRFPAENDLISLPLLRMAGGEFCGNASLCAAFLYFLHKKDRAFFSKSEIRLLVSGINEPVEVHILDNDENSCIAGILMPPVSWICKSVFKDNDIEAVLPVVEMKGISHIIIDEDSAFFTLKKNRNAAEAIIKKWCERLAVKGLGIMFIEKGKDQYKLTPLVYIPESNTVFWEHSCASGSSAAGIFLGSSRQEPSVFLFSEPGGTLRVTYDPGKGETWLYNRISVIRSGSN